MMNLPEGAQSEYFSEITQLEQALQCVQLARDAGADNEMLMAALLLKIGHLMAEAVENGA